MRDLISSRMRQVQSVRCIACLPTARLCIVSSMAYRHLPANREALHLHRQGCNRKSCPARVYNNGTSCMSGFVFRQNMSQRMPQIRVQGSAVPSVARAHSNLCPRSFAPMDRPVLVALPGQADRQDDC